jgi:hypothetical protein
LELTDDPSATVRAVVGGAGKLADVLLVEPVSR